MARSTSAACANGAAADRHERRRAHVAANGSAHVHPYHSTRSVDMITPTEPNASASTCRNIARAFTSAATLVDDSFDPVHGAPRVASVPGSNPIRDGGSPRSNSPVRTSHAASGALSGHPGGRLSTSDPSSENAVSRPSPGNPRATNRCAPDSGSTTMISPSGPLTATCAHVGGKDHLPRGVVVRGCATRQDAPPPPGSASTRRVAGQAQRETDEVDDEAQDGDDEEVSRGHFSGFHDSLDALEDDEEGDEDEEEGVYESGDDVDSRGAEMVGVVRGRGGGEGGVRGERDGGVVEEHVEGVGDEADGVVGDADGELDEHEGGVD